MTRQKAFEWIRDKAFQHLLIKKIGQEKASACSFVIGQFEVSQEVAKEGKHWIPMAIIPSTLKFDLGGSGSGQAYLMDDLGGFVCTDTSLIYQSWNSEGATGVWVRPAN